MADITTTTSCPAWWAAAMRWATALILARLGMEDPPYFWMSRAMTSDASFGGIGERLRCAGVDGVDEDRKGSVEYVGGDVERGQNADDGVLAPTTFDDEAVPQRVHLHGCREPGGRPSVVGAGQFDAPHQAA